MGLTGDTSAVVQAMALMQSPTKDGLIRASLTSCWRRIVLVSGVWVGQWFVVEA